MEQSDGESVWKLKLICRNDVGNASDMDGNIVFVFLLIIVVALLNRKWGGLLGVIALLWLFSFRTIEIPDTDMYQWMYDDPISRIGYDEIGYLFLGYIFKSATNAEFIVYYLVMVGFCLFLWYNSSRRILSNKEHWGMLFLIFISFFGFLYMGVLIRNCISELLLLCGLSLFITNSGKKKYIFYMLFVLLATLIHKSSIFFILLIPLFRHKVSTRKFYCFFVICIIIWLISGVGFAKHLISEISKVSMFSGYDRYATSTEASPNMLSLQVLMSLFVSFCAIKNNKYIKIDYKKAYECFLKINMVGIFLLSIIWSLPTSYRFYNVFIFFNYVLIYLMIFQNIKIASKGKQIICSLSISIVYFLILLHSFPFLLLY